MDTDTTTEADVDSSNNEGEGETKPEVVTIPKTDWEKTQQTLGSLKRENKDLKKAQETPKETPQSNQKPDDALLQRHEKLVFKQYNVSHEDDKELAQKTAKKWNMDIEDVLEDEDFQLKLKKQQDSRANVEATSGVKGQGEGKVGGKAKSDFWINSNTPPTDADVETYKIPKMELAKIIDHFVKSKGSNKMFYND